MWAGFPPSLFKTRSYLWEKWRVLLNAKSTDMFDKSAGMVFFFLQHKKRYEKKEELGGKVSKRSCTHSQKSAQNDCTLRHICWDNTCT